MKCCGATNFCLFTTLILVLTYGSQAGAQDYRAADPALKVVRIDSSKTESFLSMRADSAGRLFVGGREALFVYEPDAKTGLKPRKEIYRFPPHSWIYDIAIRGNDLYVLTMSALYVIPDGVVKREGLKPRRLLWGVPAGHVHQCFHGLAWGPEGDLYISMGDPMWYYGDFNRPDHWGHWTFVTADGKKNPYTGVGGVFRIRPDGTDFRVFAPGLRNPCGIAFDHNWNLFTNDNDHEGMPSAYVPGRLLHVASHADFGWPRGWMPHITSDRADLLKTMFTGMGRAVPVGQSYYDEPFLPKKYRHALLIARWGQRTVNYYPLKQRGASFQAKEQALLIGSNQARPVGVSVGRGGRIFVTISYMAHNESSPVYRSDLVMITRKDDKPPYRFDGFDITKATSNKLAADLGANSWLRRRQAQGEISRRGIRAFAKNLSIPPPTNDRVKAGMMWIGGTAHRNSSAENRRILLQEYLTVIRGENQPNRVHAARIIGRFFADLPEARTRLVELLGDANPQVQLAAVDGLNNTAGELPRELSGGPARSDDSYIRQAACLLLARRATLSQLKALCVSTDNKKRLAGVLAVGMRLTIPAIDQPIPNYLPLQPWRSAKVYTIQFANAKVDLRTLGRVGLFTTAEHWKAARLAGKRTAEQESLFALLKARLADANEQVALQAAHYLLQLNDRRTEGAIAKVRSDTERRRLATARMFSVSKAWVAGPFDDGNAGFKRRHPPETGVIDLSKPLNSNGKPIAWRTMSRGVRMFDFLKAFGKCDGQSFYTYFRIESPRKQQVMLLVGSDDGVKVWHNGTAVWTNDVSRAALPYQDVVYLHLQPGSNDMLIRVRNISGECVLYTHFRAANDVVVTLPDRLGIAGLAARLKQAADSGVKLDPAFATTDWNAAALKGRVERGRKLFGVNGIGCAKCHSVKPGEAVQGGPSLIGAGKRFTIPYLVESILLPSKSVSPVFRATMIVTNNGKSYSGLVLGETAEKIDLLLPDAKRLSIKMSDIEIRKLQDISPMPAGLIRKPEELQDLLAFLLSRRESVSSSPNNPSPRKRSRNK